MTIKKELDKKFINSHIIGIAAWLLILLLSIIPIDALEWVKFVAFMVFVGSGFYMSFGIHCPQCKDSVFWTQLKTKKLSFQRVPDVCGHCGCDYLQEHRQSDQSI